MRGGQKKARSQAWFGRQDKMGFNDRPKNRGFPHDRFDDRVGGSPVPRDNH